MGQLNRRAFLRQTVQFAAGALLTGCTTLPMVGAANARVAGITDHRNAAVAPPLLTGRLQPVS